MMMQDNPNEENPESKKKSSITYLAPRRGGYRLIGIRSFKTHKRKTKKLQDDRGIG
jgi:hypothetical protein